MELRELIDELFVLCNQLIWHQINDNGGDPTIIELLVAGHGNIKSSGPWGVYMLARHNNAELSLIMETHAHPGVWMLVPATQDQLTRLRALVTVNSAEEFDA
jgi:hypothetical protein